MEPFQPKPKKGPEARIQEAICSYLRAREWVVMETHGNIYQKGFPDLYCAHFRYGARWIECKNAEKYEFTREQRRTFPMLASVNVGVWILVAATEDEYLKLWQPANWHQYLHEIKPISRPRPSLRNNEGYVPKYPIVNKDKK